MISLVYPSENSDLYLLYNGTLMGPYGAVGTEMEQRIDFRYGGDAISDWHAMYHENNVAHSKVDADIIYQPALTGAIKVTDPRYCESYKVPAKNHAGLNITLTCNQGILASTVAVKTLERTTTVQSETWRAAQRTNDGLSWVLWTISTTVDSTKIQNYQKLTFTIGRWKSGNAYACRMKQEVWPIPKEGLATGIDWCNNVSFKTIASLKYTGTGKVSVVENDTSLSIYKVPRTLLSPASIKSSLQSYIVDLNPKDFPLEDIHYGDLAAEAAEKVNSNHVNMFEFLSGLRHPQDLIPKLRNLKKLKYLKSPKTYSDEFLRAKYGVLPTISDIQEIFGAMKKVSQYVDRNGYSIYTAVRSQSMLDTNGISYSKTQRLKLAVDNEDNSFQALCERLDNIGFLPTISNIWDLIPYSFVIDWFINVGDFLERIDNSMRLERLNIRYVTMSRKAVASINLLASPTQPLTGVISQVHYHRWTSGQCPVPPLSLQENPDPTNHWLEGGALIISHAKRH